MSEPNPIVYDENDRRVYRLDDGSMVISEGGAWLVGVYADLPAALRAFKVDDAVLAALRDVANRAPDPADRVITLEMLREADDSAVGGKPEGRPDDRS